MKKSLFKALLPTMAMILVAVMALTGTTYAWFTNQQFATVSQIDITVTAASAMKVAIVKHGQSNTSAWTNQLRVEDLKSSANANWINASDFKPASSTTGKAGSFYYAEIDESNNDNLKSVTDQSTNYLRFEVYVWNDSAKGRYVSLDSSAVSGLPSSALRISMVDMGSVATSYTSGNVLSSATTTAETACGIWEPTGVSSTKALMATTTTSTPKEDTSIAAVQTTKALAKDVKVAIASQEVRRIAIYIWLEGQDADCVNSITSKQFSVNLRFDGTVEQ